MESSGQGASSTGRPFLTDVAKAVESAVSQIDYQTAAQPDVAAAVQSESDSISGTCGGTAAYSIQVDTTTGLFSGSFSFHAYCEGGMTINGTTRFSGAVNVNVNPPVLQWFTLSFDYITGTSATESIAMDGQITLSLSGSTLTATMDMMIQDNSTSRVCKVENYQMDITDYGSYVEFEANGRFFDPDYGYVDLVTEQPFLVYSGDENPTSGQAVVSGKDGTAGGPQQARLTAIDATHCQVEADLDGDGAFDDYDSGPIPWTDL